MIDSLRNSATNEHSQRMADELAKEWQVDRYWPKAASQADLVELAAWRKRQTATP